MRQQGIIARAESLADTFGIGNAIGGVGDGKRASELPAVVEEMLPQYEIFHAVLCEQFLVIGTLRAEVFALKAQQHLNAVFVFLLCLTHFIDIIPDFRHRHAQTVIIMRIRHMIAHAEFVKLTRDRFGDIILHRTLGMLAAETMGVIIGKHFLGTSRVLYFIS